MDFDDVPLVKVNWVLTLRMNMFIFRTFSEEIVLAISFDLKKKNLSDLASDSQI